MSKIKVLVVDDSALVRKMISDALEKDSEIEVVGTANNGKTAIFKNQTLNPDVITLDIEMPIMNGLDALQEIIRTHPKPVIMMSVLTQHGAEATFKALEYGAVDFVPKPSTMLSMSVEEINQILVNKVKQVYKSKIKFKPVSREITEERRNRTPQRGVKVEDRRHEIKPLEGDFPSVSSKVVAIGTSTGGPSALITVFKSFPLNFPSPVLVVQHMPEGFTRAFAERLNCNSTLEVKEAEDGDRILPGRGFLAPGHSHILVEERSGGKYIRLSQSEKVSGHRPSIDVLFHSVSDYYRRDIIAVIMTGMGRDGADGITRIHDHGGYTIAQNEETSVVYGMNRVAVELGGIDTEVPLIEIPKKIVEKL